MTNTPANSAVKPCIQVFALGDFQTNCMILTQGEPEPGKSCWIIDCGYQPEPMLDAIEEQGLIPVKIILTHAHADHIAGLIEARSRFAVVPILMHKIEESWMNDPVLNLSAALGLSITAPSPTEFLDEGDTVSLGELEFRVVHTPGHSPGSISLIHEPSKLAFVGDTLFAGSIGRTDFPGSSFETLENSIKTKLYVLDPETVCFPGHGPATTIGQEMNSNPFVKM
ncbi:MAG: MBL fold metallo-hydrolase [Phycisphaerales bacterium]|nr:MBL fold metallo-hydrolase [Phycisphaerales bacterium]